MPYARAANEPGSRTHGHAPKPHRAAHFVHAKQLAQFIDDAVGRGGIKFGAVRMRQARDVARVFNRGALHAEANSKKRHLVISRVLNCMDHSLNSAFAESAGDEDAIHICQAFRGGGRRIELFRFDPFDHRAQAVRQPAMHQRFAQTFIGVAELDILAHHADAHFAFRIAHAVQHFHPLLKFSRRRFHVELLQELIVQAFARQLDGDRVNCVHILRGNYARFGNVAE